MKESALGKSVIVYHGTKVAFDKFDFDKAADGAHFFTPIKEHAEHFGKASAYRVVINNPLIITQDDLEAEWDKEHPDGEQDDRDLLPRDFVDEFVLQAKAKGHDGLIIERFADLDFQTTVYLPFSPEQIHNADLASEQTIHNEGRQSMKERNTLETIVYAQAAAQMLSHSSAFKNAADALDYLGHCVKKQIEPIGLVRKAPFETMDWPHVHDYAQAMATQNLGTMKNLLDLAHSAMVEGAMEGEFDSADMNMLDLEDMIDRGNGLNAIKVPQSIAPGISSPTYTDRALVAARGDVIVPLGDLKAVAYVDDESGMPAIKVKSPAVLEELCERARAPGSIVLNPDKPMVGDTWYFDLGDTDASFFELGKVLSRLDVSPGAVAGAVTDLKAALGGNDNQRSSQTVEEAKRLVGEALEKFGLPEPVWRHSQGSVTHWEYADVDVGSNNPLVVGASASGVVSVDGNPFTPVTRELNVTSDRVLKSIQSGIESLQVAPASRINVAIYDTRGAAFTDIGKQTEAARILKEAAKFIRDNDVYEGVELHDVNGNKVGAISTGWGDMCHDVHAAFVNPGDSKEVSRLIDVVANNVERGTTGFYLYDIDGKNIGQGSTVDWYEEPALDAVDDARNDMQM